MPIVSRRHFLKTALAACCGSAVAGVAGAWGMSSSAAGGKRPNIIFLLTDDQRARTSGIEEHPIIKTPHLDKLMEQGVRFTNAYVTDPTCMPSRTTFFSGLYERVHGVGFSSGNSLSEAQWSQTYPELLRQSGYYTGFIGKFGLQRYAFQGKAETKFDYWQGHDGWACFWQKQQKGGGVYKDAKEDIITPIMGECIEEFLDGYPGDKPFCLSVSFSAPHGSISGTMVPGEKRRMEQPANTVPALKDHPIYGNLYRDQDVTIPEDTGTDPGRYIPETVLHQKARSATYDYNYRRETCLEHHYRYYQLITGIDHVVGQMVEGLKKRGLSENTVVIYSSDHGLLMGEYGMGGKALLYDLATRVPLVVYDPRFPETLRGKQSDAFVLSVDVAPTILAYAGVQAPSFMQGRNLIPLIQQPDRPWRKDIFLENLYIGRSNPLIEGVRNKQWKYIRYFPKPKDPYRDQDVTFGDREPVYEQLFDLQNDPEEKNNLAADEKHAEVLARLRKRCRSYSDDMAARRCAYKGIMAIAGDGAAPEQKNSGDGKSRN